MQLVADLHIHSRFSRATSKDLDFVSLHRAAKLKGIGLVGTGDFTHPGWMAEISSQLVPAEEGLFRLDPELQRAAEEGLPPACTTPVRFVLQVEISNIYKKADRVRKNHNLVYLPSLEAARRFSSSLAAIGNLASDGRPILGLDARDLLEITLETDPQAFLVPAHIWTPWFSLLGSKSGFDSLDECFGDLAGHVFAVETGLSSDPPMNWRLSQLDRMTLISSSDAHSAGKLGREATLLDVEPSFSALRNALATGEGYLGTIEFYPEEGKYHLDGHRKCGMRLEPEQTRRLDGRCPKCGGKLTVGVMSRVLDLADRPPGSRPQGRRGYTSLVPLDEVIGEVLGVGPGSKRVLAELDRLRAALGHELDILRTLPLEDIQSAGGAPLAEAIRRVRTGELEIAAGYDGDYGIVSIFSPGECDHLFGQLSFFASEPPPQRKQARAAAADVEMADEGPRSKPAVVAEPQPSSQNDQDPLHGLDEQQAAAARTATGPLLVVAGPGTGKTRTIVARIAEQLRSGAVEPEQVLAISFTNQAAEELRERLDRVPEAAGRLTVTTFHGLGMMLLDELDGSRPELISEEERQQLGGRLSERGGERAAGQLLDRISRAKQSVDPEATLGSSPGEGELLSAYEQYQEALGSRGLCDLDDLVLRPLQLLRDDPEVARRIADRYHSISVDEYQDVNDVQAALLGLLSPAGRTLAVIGDPNQAIYGFRGARPGHFLRFTEELPDTTVVRLGRSYRLTHEILAAASSIVGGYGGLCAGRHGPPVELVSCPTPESEAEQVLVRLERIVGGTSHFAVDSGRGDEAELAGVGFGDMAVLCRTKTQRQEILEALGRSAVPCRAVGEDEAHDPRSQKVAIMTMHAAKGREFEVVFVTGVEPGLLPLQVPGMLTSDEAEERRLLYVAITRGRQLVVLSHAARRSLWGRQLPGGPSPFLADLPGWAVHRTTPELPKKQPVGEQLSLF